MSFRDLTKEQLEEEALIDLSFAILQEKRETLTFQDLMNEIQSLNGLSDEEMKERSLQFYTDMNIDGRFLAIDGNRWGLREWYPVEQIEEETAPTVKIRKKKAKAALDDEDYEEELEEDEILFEEDFDEFVEDEEVEDEEDLDFEDEEEIDEIEEIEEDLIDDDEDLEILDDDEEVIEDDELEEEE